MFGDLRTMTAVRLKIKDQMINGFQDSFYMTVNRVEEE